MSEGDFDTIIEEYEQALANMQREYDKRGDRIEELEKACKEWSEVSQSNYQRAKAAEAKLASLVPALSYEGLRTDDAEAKLAKVAKERDEWQSLAEAAITDDAAKNIHYAEIQAKLTIAMVGLVQSRDELDLYSQNEYPSDHPVHERYRKRDYDANPARIAIAKIKGEQP